MCPDIAVSAAPTTVTELCRLVEERFGLAYTHENAFLLERRVCERACDLGLHSLDEYRLLLVGCTPSQRANEWAQLFELLSTRETYFFRETYQLDVFREVLLPEVCRAQAHETCLDVWSAGCASGEETYSIAIEILQSGLFSDGRVRVVGSDLSQRALQTAQAAVYGPSSFRQTLAERQQKHFHPVQDKWQVHESVRALCSFVPLNLMSQDFGAVGGPFQAIFCRNVLIYFDRRRRPGLIQRLCDRLLPGGYLFLGHAETLLGEQTPLVPTRLGTELVYRKPLR